MNSTLVPATTIGNNQFGPPGFDGPPKSTISYSTLVANLYAIAILNSVFNFVTLVIDIVALIGIIKANNFSSGNRVFLINLIIIDLISAVSLQPCTSANLYLWIKSDHGISMSILYKVINALHYILTISSFFAFTTVSVDRYMLLYQPYHYVNVMSTRKAAIISVTLNIVVIISFTVLHFTAPPFKILMYFGILIYVSIACLLFIHMRIMVTAMITYKKIRQSSIGAPSRQSRLRRRRVEVKQAGMTVALFLTIIICYLPIIIVGQIAFVYQLDPLLAALVYHWSFLIMLACPIAKQILLCVINKEIRAAVKRWVFLLREPQFL